MSSPKLVCAASGGQCTVSLDTASTFMGLAEHALRVTFRGALLRVAVGDTLRAPLAGGPTVALSHVERWTKHSGLLHIHDG